MENRHGVSRGCGMIENCKLDQEQELLANIYKIHTTERGRIRIQKNLKLSSSIDSLEYCKELLIDKNCLFCKRGKNWYALIHNIQITVHSHSYTIITAHIIKGDK